MIQGGVVEPFLRCANLLPEPMLLVTADGEIVAANQGAEEQLSLDGSLRGRRLQDLVDGDSQSVSQYLRICVRSRQLLPGSLSLVQVGGESRSKSRAFRAEGAVFQPHEGDRPALIVLRLQEKERAVARFIALNERIDQLGREITRRKRTEVELRRQREWLRVMLESIGDAVIATDKVGAVAFMNPTAQELIGWTQEEAQGRPLNEVFHIVNEDTRLPVENPVAKVLREGARAGLANHTVLIARDGREIPIDDCAAPIRDEQGRMLGVVMVFHDVLERRRLEQELRARAESLAETDRRKDEFLAMLAHELRNPLAPIRNSLYILGSPEASPVMVSRAKDMIERQVHHMVRLVDDLLDVSRITRAKVELRMEQVDLGDLLERVAEMVRPMAEQAGVELSVAIPQWPLTLNADPTRLEQIVVNLLQNAVKFTPQGGQVDLTAEAKGGEAVVRVRDTGVGIPAELIPKLFEPFFQVAPSIDRAKGGLGLGLTLVRALTEMHGGSVSSHSSGPDQGSEFTLRLPLAG
jgi:PAS domain S-box-containing protein